MKKRLFFHIGPHKTATTFLQSSLVRNSVVLDELGILYPKAGRIYQAHFKLARVLKNPKMQNCCFEELGEWPALLSEVDASPHHTVVISAEEFSYRFNPERLAELGARYDVGVVYYLRSPDSFMESFYNQFVKDFATRETRQLDTYLAEEQPFFLETMANLAPWAKVFGDDAIHLRLFGREHMHD